MDAGTPMGQPVYNPRVGGIEEQLVGNQTQVVVDEVEPDEDCCCCIKLKCGFTILAVFQMFLIAHLIYMYYVIEHLQDYLKDNNPQKQWEK